MSKPGPDGKHVLDATNTELGENLKGLVSRTLKEYQTMIGDSPMIGKTTNSLTGYMLNNTMVFMQFIELLITAHKTGMMMAYQETLKKYPGDK